MTLRQRFSAVISPNISRNRLAPRRKKTLHCLHCTKALCHLLFPEPNQPRHHSLPRFREKSHLIPPACEKLSATEKFKLLPRNGAKRFRSWSFDPPSSDDVARTKTNLRRECQRISTTGEPAERCLWRQTGGDCRSPGSRRTRFPQRMPIKTTSPIPAAQPPCGALKRKFNQWFCFIAAHTLFMMKVEWV